MAFRYFYGPQDNSRHFCNTAKNNGLHNNLAPIRNGKIRNPNSAIRNCLDAGLCGVLVCRFGSLPLMLANAYNLNCSGAWQIMA